MKGLSFRITQNLSLIISTTRNAITERKITDSLRCGSDNII